MKDKAKGFLLGAATVAAVVVSAGIVAVKSLHDTIGNVFTESLKEAFEEEVSDGTFMAIIEGGRAYWIANGVLMIAPVDDNDEIDFEFATEYDAINAPRGELSKVMLIMDSLLEKK